MSTMVYGNSGEQARRDAGIRRSQATPRLTPGCLPSARLGRLLITAQEPWRSGQPRRDANAERIGGPLPWTF
jgi:hypothetical protein